MDNEITEPIQVPESEEFDFARIQPDADVTLVSSQIEKKYGFTPSDEYVTDLIAFVRDMLQGAEQDVEQDIEDDAA